MLGTSSLIRLQYCMTVGLLINVLQMWTDIKQFPCSAGKQLLRKLPVGILDLPNAHSYSQTAHIVINLFIKSLTAFCPVVVRAIIHNNPEAYLCSCHNNQLLLLLFSFIIPIGYTCQIGYIILTFKPLLMLSGIGRPLVHYCGQGSSLLWIPALRPYVSSVR